MSPLPSHSDDKAAANTPKISGANTLALTLNLRAAHIYPLLVRHGLTDIHPDQWYDQRQVVSLFREMQTLPEMSYEDFVAIGMKSIETVPLPPDLNSIDGALRILPHAYQLNHQHIPDDEGYTVTAVSETHYVLEANTPYPAYVVYGVIYGLTRRYSAGKSHFQVALRSEAPLIIDISW